MFFYLFIFMSAEIATIPNDKMDTFDNDSCAQCSYIAALTVHRLCAFFPRINNNRKKRNRNEIEINWQTTEQIGWKKNDLSKFRMHGWWILACKADTHKKNMIQTTLNWNFSHLSNDKKIKRSDSEFLISTKLFSISFHFYWFCE